MHQRARVVGRCRVAGARLHRDRRAPARALGIGQGEIGETPLQMANATAAIANRGYWYTPHMVKKIVGDDSSLASFREKHVLPIDSSYFKYVLKGLLRVVEAGTGTIAQIPGVTIAGKTGTGNIHDRATCHEVA